MTTKGGTHGGLDKWFAEKWVDVSRPKKGGGFEQCGRKDADTGKYPKCRPAKSAAKMSAGERKSAITRKRKAEASAPAGKGRKPIMVSTKTRKKDGK